MAEVSAEVLAAAPEEASGAALEEAWPAEAAASAEMAARSTATEVQMVAGSSLS